MIFEICQVEAEPTLLQGEATIDDRYGTAAHLLAKQQERAELLSRSPHLCIGDAQMVALLSRYDAKPREMQPQVHKAFQRALSLIDDHKKTQTREMHGRGTTGDTMLKSLLKEDHDGAVHKAALAVLLNSHKTLSTNKQPTRDRIFANIAMAKHGASQRTSLALLQVCCIDKYKSSQMYTKSLRESIPHCIHGYTVLNQNALLTSVVVPVSIRTLQDTLLRVRRTGELAVYWLIGSVSIGSVLIGSTLIGSVFNGEMCCRLLLNLISTTHPHPHLRAHVHEISKDKANVTFSNTLFC